MEDNRPKLVMFSKKEKFEEKEDNVVLITYQDNSDEIIKADAFAFADEMPGFLAIWREDPYELIAFINSISIKKVEVIPNVFDDIKSEEGC